MKKGALDRGARPEGAPRAYGSGATPRLEPRRGGRARSARRPLWFAGPSRAGGAEGRAWGESGRVRARSWGLCSHVGFERRRARRPTLPQAHVRTFSHKRSRQRTARPERRARKPRPQPSREAATDKPPEQNGRQRARHLRPLHGSDSTQSTVMAPFRTGSHDSRTPQDPASSWVLMAAAATPAMEPLTWRSPRLSRDPWGGGSSGSHHQPSLHVRRPDKRSGKTIWRRGWRPTHVEHRTSAALPPPALDRVSKAKCVRGCSSREHRMMG